METRLLGPQRRKRTETVSFRLNSSLRSALEEESRNTSINLNTLVAQILTRYVTWGRYAGKLKFLPASKDLLRELFQTVGKEPIEKMAKKLGEIQAREEMLFVFQQVNPNVVLRFVELWSSHFDASEHSYDGKRHFFTIHHDVNQNFSIFVKEYINSMIQHNLGKTVQFETVSPNSITFSFEG